MKTSTYLASSLVLLSSFFLGCATKDAYDIRPEDASDGIPTGVVWQGENEKALAEATRPETLAEFVASDAAADALLAQLKGAYETDPLVMTQIGCVTQFVLCPKCSKAPAGRKVWVAALVRRMKASDDTYIRTFCRQQLDLCE